MIWAHCTYAAPVLFLPVMLEIKVWALGVLIATRVSWLLGLWWTRVKQYLHVQTDALSHTHTHTCIHATWECFLIDIFQKWAHTKISNSNSSAQFLPFHMSLLPQRETWLPKTVTRLLNANKHLEFFQNCFANITTKNTLKLFRIFFFFFAPFSHTLSKTEHFVVKYCVHRSLDSFSFSLLSTMAVVLIWNTVGHVHFIWLSVLGFFPPSHFINLISQIHRTLTHSPKLKHC